jgi:hypothetical protein
MMPNNNWINFPKNPYDGQVFYYPPTEDTFTYIAPSKKIGEGQWIMITHQDFSKPY